MEEEDEFKYIVRVAGVDIDGNKPIPYGLSKIRGIGIRTGEIICKILNIDPKKRIGYLSEEEIKKIDDAIVNFDKLGLPSWLFNRRKDYVSGEDKHLIGSDLMISLREDIMRLRKIRSYRGIRHELGLPVRGQRTRTCFRRGVTVGVQRKKKGQQQKEKKK